MKSKIIYKKLPQDDPKQRKPDISLAKKELTQELGTIYASEGWRVSEEFLKFIRL